MASQRSKFSVAAATTPAKKNQASVEPTSGRPAKVPKACEITVQDGPRPQQTPQRLPTSAPVNVVMYKVSDVAGDVWEAYQGKEVPLWQVQIDHPAQRAITFDMRNGFNDFLRTAHAGAEALPTTVQDLERGAGIRLVVSDRADPEDVGFVQWRVAFYVAGDLKNFLLLLDGWFLYKERAMAREQPLEVHLHPHTGVDAASAWGELEYEHYTLNEPSATLPLGIFEAQPVMGKSIVVLNLQLETPEQLSVVITGKTWSFRSRLDAYGVAGGYSNEENRKYFRVLKSLDVSEAAQQERGLQMIGDSVFNNLAMRVVLNEKPEPDTHVAAFVEKLKELPSLHFSRTGA